MVGINTQAARAKLRYLRVSPQKARLVIDLIRGEQVEKALNILSFTQKAVAKDVKRLLWSAIANAKDKDKDGRFDESSLFVTEAYVDGGPIHKRIRARAQGRAFRVVHRTSHITLAVGQKAKK